MKTVSSEHWGWNSTYNKNNLRTNGGWDYTKHDYFSEYQ